MGSCSFNHERLYSSAPPSWFWGVLRPERIYSIIPLASSGSAPGSLPSGICLENLQRHPNLVWTISADPFHGVGSIPSLLVNKTNPNRRKNSSISLLKSHICCNIPFPKTFLFHKEQISQKTNYNCSFSCVFISSTPSRLSSLCMCNHH